jgi:hypothetical protein
VAESKLPHSNVSVLVEPQLNDSRLVVRIAAKNLGRGPAPFGPGNVTVARPGGQAVGLYPLAELINDIRAAAGMADEPGSVGAPTQGAYAAPQMGTRDGKVDVSGYTGGVAVASDQYTRSRNQARKGKPTISEADATAQIAMLKQAIIHDQSLAPGQIAAGQIVSQKLAFKKGDDRTLHLRIRLAGDEHAFTIEAPKD